MESIDYGNDSWNLDLVGKELKAILGQYRDLFNIPSNARIEVNGATVSDEYVIQEGDRIEAVRETGVKGMVSRTLLAIVR